MNTTTQTTTLDLTRITIGAFKHFAGMSEETEAFTANVVLDGKVIGYADNHGKGGCTHVRFLGDNRHEMEVHQTAIADHIDTLIDAKLNEKHLAKTVAKIRRDAHKSVMYLKVGHAKGFVSSFKNVTDATRQRAIDTAKANPDFKCLVADMTDADLVAWFIA
jgi:hypothetical protein